MGDSAKLVMMVVVAQELEGALCKLLPEEATKDGSHAKLAYLGFAFASNPSFAPTTPRVVATPPTTIAHMCLNLELNIKSLKVVVNNSYVIPMRDVDLGRD